MAVLGNGLNICTGCDDENHDGETLTIKISSGVTSNRTTGDADGDHATGCGWSVACAKRDYDPSTGHLRRMSLIIEEPAFEYNKHSSIHTRVFWTDVEGDDLDPVYDSSRKIMGIFHYIKATMTHEFGHTLGLSDFEGTTLDHLRAVMRDHHRDKEVTQNDITELRHIYGGHLSNPH